MAKVIIVRDSATLSADVAFLKNRLETVHGDTVTDVAWNALPADLATNAAIYHVVSSYTAGAYDDFPGLVLALHWDGARKIGMHSYGGGGGGLRTSAGIYGDSANIIPRPEPIPTVAALTVYSSNVATAHMGRGTQDTAGTTFQWAAAAKVVLLEQAGQLGRTTCGYYTPGDAMMVGVAAGWRIALSLNSYSLLTAAGLAILDDCILTGRVEGSGPFTVDWTGETDKASSIDADGVIFTQNTGGLWATLGGKARHAASNAGSIARTSKKLGTDRQKVVLLVNAQASTGGTNEIGAVCSYSSGSDISYYVFLVKHTGVWNIRKILNGVESVLLSGTFEGMVWPYELTLEVDGGQIRAFISITRVGSVTDPAPILGNKQVGIRAYSSTGSTVDVTSLTATDLPVASPPPAAPVLTLTTKDWDVLGVDIAHDLVNVDHFKGIIDGVVGPNFLGPELVATGLLENTQHTLQVVAYNSTGDFAESNIITGTTFYNTGLYQINTDGVKQLMRRRRITNLVQ